MSIIWSYSDVYLEGKLKLEDGSLEILKVINKRSIKDINKDDLQLF